MKGVKNSIEHLSAVGLRALVFGMKEIEWDETRNPRDLKVEEVESDLTLLGATAMEDLLQENVSECITDFRRAGIKVWMLTGDKGLTAKNIGYTCGILRKATQSS